MNLDSEHVRAALEAWLRRHCAAPELTVAALSRAEGGASSETLFVRTRSPIQPHDQSWVMRIARNVGQLYLAADVGREWRVLQALDAAADVPTPRPLALERDPAVLGAPFFLMEFVPGKVLNRTPPYNAAGWLADASANDREAIWLDALKAMTGVARAPVDEFTFLLEQPGADGLGDALDYWRRYLRWASPTPHPTLEGALDWLMTNAPSNRKAELSWGDARMGNMIFQDARCAALIDWERPSLAGAEADLAWWLLFDLCDSEMIGLERLPGLGDAAATVAHWERFAGRSVQDLDYHLVFAAFRLAAILERARHTAASRSPSARHQAVMTHLERGLAERRA